MVEHAKPLLERAAENGQQVVVTEGIEFRWRPTPIDTTTLADYEAAVDALAGLLSITPKWQSYKGGDAARVRQVARYVLIRDAAESALFRLRGDR